MNALSTIWLSINVLPRYTAYCLANADCTDADFAGKCLVSDTSSSVSDPDLADDGDRQFGVCPVFSTRLPALGYLVGLVVGIRAEEQVGGIDTDGIVAVMTDVESIWNRTMMDFPRDAVSEEYDSLLPTVVFDLPITCKLSMPCPQPTAILPRAYLLPEAFGKWLREGVLAQVATEGQAALHVAGQSLEGFLTGGADVDLPLRRITGHADSPYRISVRGRHAPAWPPPLLYKED